MAKLKDVIPDGFYDIFSSKHRETYFAYLKGMYSAVKLGRYSIKGITKDDCKEIIHAIPSEDYDEDEVDVKEFDNKYLNNLIKKGWLGMKYEPSLGEDLITFPQYSSLFIEVIFSLDEDIDKMSEASMRQIHGAILSFWTFGPLNRGYEYLLDAISYAHQYCIRLTSLLDVVREMFETILEDSKENGTQVPNDVFEKYLKYNECVRENTNGVFKTGSFMRHIAEMEDTLAECSEKIDNELGDIFSLKLELTQENDLEELEKDEKKLNKILDDIDSFKREMYGALELYNKTLDAIGEAAETAKKKAQFINSFEGTESVARLNKIISYLGSNDDVLTEPIYNLLAEKLSVESEMQILDERGLCPPTKRTKKVFEPVFVSKKEHVEIALSSPLKSARKYTRNELKEFEDRNKIGNKVTICKDSISCEDDFYKLINLWFDIIKERDYEISDIDLGRTILVNEEFEFTEFTYVRKEIGK